MTRSRRRSKLAGLCLAALLLGGCSDAREDAAAGAAEACDNERLTADGPAVRFELTGGDAAAFGDAQQALDDGDLEGMGDGWLSALEALTALDCLVDHTEYPGVRDDLRDGDEWWDGWRYEDGPVVGSEIRFAFIATD